MRRAALGGAVLTGFSVMLQPSLAAQAAPDPLGRTFARGAWRERTVIRGEALLQPFLMKVAGRSIVVFDYGDFQLKAFSLEGKPLWHFGRQGQGPWELSAPSDLQVSSAG